MIRRGEILFAIDVFDGELYLRPVSSHDIQGDYARWDYRLNLAGPSEQITRDRVPSEGVCHVMYANDPETPWRGVSPLGVAPARGETECRDDCRACRRGERAAWIVLALASH